MTVWTPGAPASRHPFVQPVHPDRNVRKTNFVAVHIVAIALFAASVFAAEVMAAEQAGTLFATLDRKSAPVGDVATLTLNFQLPEGGTLTDPPAGGGLEHLTILGRDVAPNKVTFRVLVDQLEILKTGALSLTWVDREKKPHALTADPVSLQVVSGLGEKPAEAQLRPLQDIVPVRPPWLRYLPWGLGALGLLLAAAGLYWWWKKRRRQLEIAKAHEAPHLWATREVERLEAQKVFEKGKVKEFYFRLSEILRRYLEAIRGFPAAEYTVEEIARYVQEEKDRQLLVLLRQVDLVKFADDVPTAARKDDELKAALAYIRATTPQPETQPAGGAPQGTRG